MDIKKLKLPFEKFGGVIPKHNLKQRIILIAVFVVLTCAYVFMFMPRTTFAYIDNAKEVYVTDEITADRPLVQQLTVGDGVMKGIGVDFQTYDRTNRAEYYISLLDSDWNELTSAKFNADKVAQGEPFYVPVPQIETQAGERYFVQIHTNQAMRGNALGAYINLGNNESAPVTMEGASLAGSLRMSLGYESMSINAWIIAIIMILAVAFAILFWSKDKMHVNATVLVLIFGVLFSLITPILDTPDEAQHCATAFIMSNGGWVAPIASGGGYLPATYDVITGNTYQTLVANTMQGVPVGAEMMQSTWGSGQFFLGYIPQTIGLWFAKLFQADLMGAFYMGRIFNLLFYAACVFFAVKTAPKFKLFMTVLALMPMALMIAGSYNSDGLVYGLALMLGAYFIDMFYNRTYQIGWKNMLIFLIVIALIAMKKYWLAPLAVLPMLIPRERFGHRKIKWVGGVVTVAVTVVAAFAIASFGQWMSIDPNAAVGTSAMDVGGMSDRGASVGQQIGWMLQNPGSAASVVSKSIMKDAGGDLMELFSLGQMDYFIYDIFMFVYFAFLAVVSFSYTRYEYKPELAKGNTSASLVSRGMVLLVIAATVLLVYLALYLTWSPVAADAVLGVQGRYFVPIFFLLPFVGQNVWPLVEKDAYDRAQYNVQFVAVLITSVTLLTTLLRYYK